MITHPHTAHGSYWDSLATFALAGGGFFVSIGHVLQGVVSVVVAVSAAASAIVAVGRFVWDLQERRAKRGKGP